MDNTPAGQYFLACDFHEGALVVEEKFSHWGDAYIAAISGGQAKLARLPNGRMQAVLPDGQFFHVVGSNEADDGHAKAKLCMVIMHENSIRGQHSRYGQVSIKVDADGFAICDSNLHMILDAHVFGQKAGIKLNPEDRARLKAHTE
jgi:hypothetical protein